jgi:hypothetical protein
MRRQFESWIGRFNHSGNHRRHVYVPCNRNGFIELKHHGHNQRGRDRAVSIAEGREGVEPEEWLTPSMIQ